MNKKLLLISAIAGLFNIANASVQVGTVGKIFVRDDGLHYFVIDGERTAKPECASENHFWMIKDENSNFGKSQFSMLLAAKMGGKTVKIHGADTCTRWGNGEDVRAIEIE